MKVLLFFTFAVTIRLSSSIFATPVSVGILQELLCKKIANFRARVGLTEIVRDCFLPGVGSVFSRQTFSVELEVSFKHQISPDSSYHLSLRYLQEEQTELRLPDLRLVPQWCGLHWLRQILPARRLHLPTETNNSSPLQQSLPQWPQQLRLQRLDQWISLTLFIIFLLRHNSFLSCSGNYKLVPRRSGCLSPSCIPPVSFTRTRTSSLL